MTDAITTVEELARYYDASIPPDLLPDPDPPDPVPPTGVTAGSPGAFTPPGSSVPATIGDLRALGIGSGPAWTEGQYVTIGSGAVHWDGADWVMGAAPEPQPEQAEPEPEPEP